SPQEEIQEGASAPSKLVPAAAAAAAPATTAAASARAASPTAAGAAPGLGQLDLDASPVQLRAVQSGDGIVGLLGRRHLDKPEPTRSAGVPVGHHTRRFDGADPGESFTEAITGGGERETSDEQFDGHENLLAAFRSEHGRNSEEAQ